MLTDIDGLHHVTSLASGARANDDFFTRVLGMRRIKTTVNFDNPRVYHLYYGDRVGTPGTVMTYFPFPDATRGAPGTGETGHVAFSIPPRSAAAWRERLRAEGIESTEENLFDETRLVFAGPDGERLVLVEAEDDRAPWVEGGIPPGMALRGLHSVSLRVAEREPMLKLLRFMGFEETHSAGSVTRHADGPGTAGHIVEIDHRPEMAPAQEGAGSVHHVAFRTADRASQAKIRDALQEAGHRVTEVRDRDYFFAIYFRTPGGILFEVATDEPGFDRDEPVETLGQSLCLPAQHAHLREELERTLEPLPAPASADA